MKIKKISLQNYKRFLMPQTFSFTDSEGEVNATTLVVGNNGSGKTSILQAIVVLLASAIRDNFKASELEWPGYDYRFLQTGSLPLKIEAEVVFDDAEIASTKQYAERLMTAGIELSTIPGEKSLVSISFDYQKMKSVSGCAKDFFQFSGYQYAKKLAGLTPQKNLLFDTIGNVYWYTEQRNSHNITNLLDDEATDTQLNDIRNFLGSTYSYHTALKKGERTIQEGEFDFYEKLESMYRKVFPGRSLVGPAPRFDIYEKAKAPDFFLFDGHNQYEISGMSAGERAIFPILMDFARWNINNSIIIIDELELHLHPPLQQALVKALVEMGNNNQFVFTSHSNSVISLFDEDENQIIRLTNE